MKKTTFGVIVLFFCIILGACDARTAEIESMVIQMSVAQTVEVISDQMILQTLTAVPKIQTDAQKNSLPTDQSISTITPSPEITATVEPSPTTNNAPNCNQAYFIDDVSIPDGTILRPGENFIKKWRLRNDGICTWTTAYQVIYSGVQEKYSGKLTGDTHNPISEITVPTGITTVSMNLFAPKIEGKYRYLFKLQDPQGKQFGIGPYGDPFWLEIEVSKDGSDTTSNAGTEISVPSTATPRTKISTTVTDASPKMVGPGMPIGVAYTVSVTNLPSGETISVTPIVKLNGIIMKCSSNPKLDISENGEIRMIAEECIIPVSLTSENYPLMVNLSSGYYNWMGAVSFPYEVVAP